ncbi:MAG: hypothetical protein J6Y48_06460, partial [Clostridia bacterium]|nr:hypothetical protein [Clostridia bacterium]
MKFSRTIRRLLCLTAALLVFASACGAEEAITVEDAGLDLTEELRIHYPALSGDGENIGTVNELIREKCRISEYLSRAAQLMVSGGTLDTEWRGSLMGDVFSCAVSATGAVETSRATHVWTAVTVDLRDGHEITLPELFTDMDAARELIETWLEETVAPDLSAHLLNSELTPMPES